MTNVNVKMLLDVIRDGYLSKPIYSGERHTVRVLDRVSYLNMTSAIIKGQKVTEDSESSSYVDLQLVAVKYSRNNQEWLEWEILL